MKADFRCFFASEAPKWHFSDLICALWSTTKKVTPCQAFLIQVFTIPFGDWGCRMPITSANRDFLFLGKVVPPRPANVKKYSSPPPRQKYIGILDFELCGSIGHASACPKGCYQVILESPAAWVVVGCPELMHSPCLRILWSEFRSGSPAPSILSRFGPVVSKTLHNRFRNIIFDVNRWNSSPRNFWNHAKISLWTFMT